MSKYDFELDLTHENSLSKIISRIKPGSTILEFGPAEGRLTRHLSEKMGCQVTVIEIDPEAYSKARQYAADGICADAEENLWVEYLHGKKYEYVIFADVLEHLKKPEKVLKNVQEFLCEGASILTSIPNIAHNKILVKLYENRFDYTEVGLLDNTHIRFWGYENLAPFFEENGYKIVYEDVVSDKGWTGDQAVNYKSIDERLLASLNERFLGMVYQFVVELKKKEYCGCQDIDKEIGKELRIAISERPTTFYERSYVFFDYGCGFEPDSYNELFAQYYKENNMYIVTIPINRGVVRARFDPVEGKKIYCRILMATDEFGNSCSVYPANAYSYKGLDVFDNIDPQYIIDANYENVKFVTVTYTFLFIGSEEVEQLRQLIIANEEMKKQNEKLNKLATDHEEIISTLNQQLITIDKERETAISGLRQELEQTNQVKEEQFIALNESLRKQRKEYEDSILYLGSQLDLARRSENFRDRIILDLNVKAKYKRKEYITKEQTLESIQQRNIELQEMLEKYKKDLEEISNSSVWRASKPLRNCKDKIWSLKNRLKEYRKEKTCDLKMEHIKNDDFSTLSQKEENKNCCLENDVKNIFAPLFLAFAQFMDNRDNEKLFFLTEGRFLQTVYKEYCKSVCISEKMNMVLDFTQRSMMLPLIEEVSDIRGLLQMAYEGLLSQLLKERFGIDSPILSVDNVIRLPEDEDQALAAIGVNAEAFLERIEEEKKAYKECLESCLKTEEGLVPARILLVDIDRPEWFCRGVKVLLGVEVEDCSLRKIYTDFARLRSEKSFEEIRGNLEMIIEGANEDSLKLQGDILKYIFLMGSHAGT